MPGAWTIRVAYPNRPLEQPSLVNDVTHLLVGYNEPLNRGALMAHASPGEVNPAPGVTTGSASSVTAAPASAPARGSNSHLGPDPGVVVI